MATYWCRPGAGGTNAGTQANPFNANPGALTAALAAATSAGDVILYHYTGQENLAADTTFTFGADNISLISVDMDASDVPTEMGTGGWIGHSSLNRSITMSAPSSRSVFIWGITLRTAGTTVDNIVAAFSDGAHFRYENAHLWQGNTGGLLSLGNSADSNLYARYVNCTFTLSNVGQSLNVGGRTVIEGGALVGSAITNIFAASVIDGNACDVQVFGLDCSAASSTANLLGNMATYPVTLRMYGCKLPSSFSMLATQTHLNASSGEVFIHDCAAGDTHGMFGHANALGSTLSDTGIYYTSGAAGQSWKVESTASASIFSPYVTPWISLYHTGTSSITPRLEILRDGSTTAYKDNAVWAEFTAKTTAGTVMPTSYTDRQALADIIAGTTGADLATGAGLGSWTGESGTAWSGKADSGSAFTPAEVGHIRGSICVGAASTVVYVDPQIRI